MPCDITNDEGARLRDGGRRGMGAKELPKKKKNIKKKKKKKEKKRKKKKKIKKKKKHVRYLDVQ